MCAICLCIFFYVRSICMLTAGKSVMLVDVVEFLYDMQTRTSLDMYVCVCVIVCLLNVSEAYVCVHVCV